MICPKCGKPQNCPCKSCRDYSSKDVVTWIWDETGELITCGHCGITKTADWWLDEEGKQITEAQR